ncbi:MAG: hypothetical protein DME53_10475 [Verrucomicrobia bacterium]|nr:MAG: hypothetical protein DME56_07760 [Verrucomicrobiota bacterium]PYK43878.1 MAG: hypothetical protein DME53_10475 [Verrucomicrobiota bacterium]
MTHTSPLGQGVGEGVAVGVALGVGVGVGFVLLTWKLSVLVLLFMKSQSVLTQTLYSPPGFGVSSYPGTVKPLEPVFRIEVS